MRLVLNRMPMTSRLLLSDCEAVIDTVQNAMACCKLLTTTLQAVVDLARDWAATGVELGFGLG